MNSLTRSLFLQKSLDEVDMIIAEDKGSVVGDLFLSIEWKLPLTAKSL
jgi:hypothetical protein